MAIKDIPLESIGLSVRSFHVLYRANVRTVGQMLEYDDKERLLILRNMGQKSANEILEFIAKYKALCLAEGTLEEPSCSDERSCILKWLQDQQVPVSVLELLSAKAYNILLLNQKEYLFQIAFLEKTALLQLFRMDEASADEILLYTADYIQSHRQYMLAELKARTSRPLPTPDQMRFLPEYRSSILEFVRFNDIPVENLALSNRPKNQLQRNGYHCLSDLIFLTEAQLQVLPHMGANSVSQIMTVILNYLEQNMDAILALQQGDRTVFWSDDLIRNRILQLYQQLPFSGFSYKEILQKLQLPEGFPEQRLNGIIGRLLAEKKLEYVDFRCYRIYEKFESYLSRCEEIDDRSKTVLQLRLQGLTLEAIAQNYGCTKEWARQLIQKKIAVIRKRYISSTGDSWFDEDYYRYFFENYAFDRQEASVRMGISETVWRYLDMLDIKQGKRDLGLALDDHQNLEIGLRLKIKNYLNRNKIFIDGRWVEKKRYELEPIIARMFCQEDMSFDTFVKVYNDYLTSEDIPYDEALYYTPAVLGTAKNRLTDSRFILWKQNEQLRYYDIDSRDYAELYETLNLDTYENVEYSTFKFTRDYPELMKKYDIRDQYELHNLLKKILPEGSFHDFHCGRTPMIKFGTFDRDGAVLNILINHSPIKTTDLLHLLWEEYGYDAGAMPYRNFKAYCHNGVYSVTQKVMPANRADILNRALTDDFYHIEQIRKLYAKLFPEADPEEVNPYNLKGMGFNVRSQYVLRNHASLEAYCEQLLTAEDIVDIRPLRKKFTYLQAFSQKLMDLKRSLEIIEFEPGQILNFRRLARGGVTKEDIRQFCNAVYDFLPEGSYFTAQSLKRDGFEAELYDLGFSDWFYANLLLSDDRFSFTRVFNNLVLYKGNKDITIQSFLVYRVCSHGCIDAFDLITELTDHFGCCVEEKSDITYRLNATQVYYDKDLDRLYANAELYYRDLDETEGY